MSNRLIIDNILVTFEVMNHISQKRGCLRGEIALKLDMSKVYDRVEWTGLEQLMIKMGYTPSELILLCSAYN